MEICEGVAQCWIIKLSKMTTAETVEKLAWKIRTDYIKSCKFHSETLNKSTVLSDLAELTILICEIVLD